MTHALGLALIVGAVLIALLLFSLIAHATRNGGRRDEGGAGDDGSGVALWMSLSNDGEGQHGGGHHSGHDGGGHSGGFDGGGGGHGH